MIPWLMALPSFIWETGPLLRVFFLLVCYQSFNMAADIHVCMHVCEHIHVYVCAWMDGKWISIFIVSAFFVRLTNVTFLCTAMALLELESPLSCLSCLLAVPTPSSLPLPSVLRSASPLLLRRSTVFQLRHRIFILH